MHRNTAFVIIVLFIIVALLTGVKIGRQVNPLPSPILPSPAQPASPLPSATSVVYNHTGCGMSFIYSPDFSLTQASDAAILVDKNTEERINIICGVEFPKPPLPPERIEESSVSGQPATIYHDASAKDGAPVDVVVFIHPVKKIEIAFFGFGENFQQLLKSLTFK